MGVRSKPYDLEWPYEAGPGEQQQVEHIDEMFRILFEDVRNGNLTIDARQVISGTLVVARGGTGLSSYVIGDLLYASGTTTLARLASVATGNALLAGGVETAPQWGKIGLTTHVSGILPVSNGGTGLSTVAQGDILYANANNSLAALNKDTNATRYLSNTGASNNPAWAQVNLANGVSGDLPFANLTQIAGLSVLGVTGNALADVAAITAGTDHQVLRRSGATLAFGQVNLAQAAAVTGLLGVANGGTGVDNTTQTYTPTLTNVANLDASTAFESQYFRVGNVVTVSGKVSVDPTAAGTVQLGISLPIASNLGAEEDCAGCAFASGIAGQGAAIRADAANNRAELIYVAVDTTNQPMYFTFSYQVI